ncbi:MAG: aspartate aminotransferase [Deltaproteobacteria bacterium GWC2_56_8]|nr:MAG: aspartate aminotransferase [Deltaproteobacteria bacterium GWB2_55_19]OGP32238.1 MAG: aspartate aminotransferase [Deltaproteobacteria bacterium GWC2_56_8]
MPEDYIQGLFAERIGGAAFGTSTKLYKFEKIKRAKAEAKRVSPNTELLDFGVGEPDEMAFPIVVEALKHECAKPENRGYSDNGIFELKEAAAKYLEKVYGVAGIDPAKEIIHSIGSKPALAMLPDAFINSGDGVLMTAPGYPILATHAEWNNGRVVRLPLKEENGFLPDLDALTPADLKGIKLLYLNYPNNPTGATATPEFFARVVEFARRNRILVVHDAAYAALSYEGRPLSFLSVEGAKEVGIEIHSFSKAFNMTGWRLAFVAGNERAVAAYGHVKDNYDSGQFIAIQKAGIYALDHTEITEKISAKYKRRLKLMVDALNVSGFSAVMPKGSFYIYVRAPKRAKRGEALFETAEDVSEFLIREAHISTVPWDDVGSYLRFSATFAAKDKDDEYRVIEEMKKRLKALELEF